MNVAVIGTGYVGLVVGSCLAESGNDVICVDNDVEKIGKLCGGHVPIHEPGLPEIIQRNLREGRLDFSADLDEAVRKSFVLFVAVGTPQYNGEPDLGAVEAVAASIGKAINRFKIIVVKSTVPVGTTERVAEIIRASTDKPFDVVSNPEFLKEGAAVDDFMKPDRVIIGARDERTAEMVRELYGPFVRTGSPILITDIRTAEMTKYASNAFLATRISFMNEFANLCEHVGADVEMVRKGMALDDRIGASFLFPGLGFGGSCFSKDLGALIATGRRHAYPLRMLEAVGCVNIEQRRRFVAKLMQHFDGQLDGKHIAVWGLAFKPRTNDMRDAPAVDVIRAVLEAGATVTVYDPEAMCEARQIFRTQVEYAPNSYACLNGADALALVTEWQAFRNPNFDRMKEEMRAPVVFDGRNIYDPQQMREMGFTYYCVGRNQE
jgi:UDPglucose 6-dehydrogenase